ncbi:MAG: AAA family ATPase [Chloroflexi bacterium]|nr:AAA family ATPase [Chloroflexota bacterium]
MPRLALTLFGSPRIELDQRPITVDTRKAIALLAYLALARQPHSRDALAALLWPEYDQSHAYAALRRTLSALNKALGGYGLAIERETIGLDDQADIWIDAEQFQNRLAECRAHDHAENEVCARCVAPLTQAVDLCREDFLAGFSLRDSAAFDDWSFFQTEQLRRELVGALDRLVQQLTAQHDYAAALAHARRWIAIDPLHEPAHRELMKLYALTGQRAAALRQYQECARVLKQELDVEPLAETTQLVEAIKANQLKGGDHLSTIVKRQTPAVSHPFPLIGRTAELHALRQAYGSSREGRFVAIAGEAGIGKTRLAEEFLAQVQDRSGAIITARCYEGEVILPYSLFADVLRAALAQPDRLHQLDRLPALWLSEAARLTPELISLRPDLPIPPPLDTPSAQGRFFEGVTQVLLALCATSQQAPTVLFLDDLNWIDEASLALWVYLVRRLHGHALLIIAAWRTENTPHGRRLRKVVADLQRSGTGTLLALAPLNQAQVAELAQACLPSTLDVAERLYRETEGLPYFVVEYLEALRAHGGEDWSLPRSVRDVLQARLTNVSEAGRQLLQTAVVIGRSFDLDTLRAASGRSEEETVSALEELIAQRLIHENAAPDVAQAPRYDFKHEKLRELIYEETGLARRRLLHQRVAQALIDRQRTPALAGSIAQHYQLSGRLTEAAEYFYRAGEYARSLYANAEALAHYQAALTAGYPNAAGIHAHLGDLHMLRGEYQVALQNYETAAALDRSQPDRVAHIEHRLGQVYQRQGKRDLAETHFAAALRTLTEPSVQAQIYTDWSLSAHHRGDTDRALELAQRALELAEASTDQRAHAQAHNVLGVLARHQGDLATAEHHLQQSLAVAAESGDRIAQVAALNNLSLVYAERNALDQALTLTMQALAECAALGDRHREAALHNNLADLLHAAGRSEEAMAHLKQAVTIFAEIGVESGALQPEIWKLAEW